MAVVVGWAQDAVPLVVGSAPVGIELGSTSQNLTDADRARELHQLGAAAFPSSRGNPEARRKAIQSLAEAVRLDPTVDVYRIDFADALLHDDNDMGKILAIDIYEEMLAANPKDDAALGRVVYGLTELGNVGAALDRLATRAKEPRPLPMALLTALNGLAVTHGKTVRVAMILRGAHRQAPGNEAIALSLAFFERELGNTREADEILAGLAKRAATSLPAAYARALLREVGK